MSSMPNRRDTMREVGMKRRELLRSALCWYVLACSLLLGPLRAQLDTGTIAVTVKDASGSAIPGAALTLRNENTGITVRTGVTNVQGAFTAALIPSGSYSLHVELRGFKSYQQSAIYLQVNEQLSVPVSLEVGEVNEVVTVTGTPLVEATSGAIR